MVFPHDLFGKPCVMFKDIGIVEGGYEKNLFNPVLHQVMKIIFSIFEFVVVFIQFF